MFSRRIVCVVSLPTTTFPKLTDEGVAESVEDVAVALTLIFMVGSVALLVSDSAPASVPAETGLYVTVKFTVCPAANVAGTVRPETLTPVPEYDILEIVAASPPVFASFTVFVASLPTATLPNAIEAGVTVSVAASFDVAVAVRSMTIDGLLALLVIETVPDSVPAEAGLYVIAKLALCPGANVIGAVAPEILTPVLVDAIFEIAALSFPLFVSLMVWVVSLPTATLPNAIEAGVAVSAAAVMPLPLSATSEGELGALLAIVIIPVSLASVVGLNAAVMDAVWPGLSDIGRCGPEAVNPAPDTEIAEMVSNSAPLLDNVTDCVALCPTAKFPKLRTVADRFIEAPVASGVVGLPAIPTQPEVTRITSSVVTPERMRRMDLGANRCERIASFTRAPSRMGARVISTRIVRWGSLPELLAERYTLGTGALPCT